MSEPTDLKLDFEAAEQFLHDYYSTVNIPPLVVNQMQQLAALSTVWTMFPSEIVGDDIDMVQMALIAAFNYGRRYESGTL